MSKEIGPKEKRNREMQEQRYQARGAGAKPSLADMRGKIAKIKPMTNKGGRRGR